MELINLGLTIILTIVSIREYWRNEVQHAIYFLLMAVALHLDVIHLNVLN